MLKWNLIDRVSTQVLYAVTGIVLARLLTPDDFGLVGAMLVFQAFANMFIDSGFSAALIQRKSPTQLDYSTVTWFNMGIAVVIYLILYVSAPGIADLFGGDARLVGMSRVMFLSFILNAGSLVQANRLTKQLNARPVAVADIVALIAGGVVGIVLAIRGAGAWAVVWQTVTYNGVRTLVLWITANWRPSPEFSLTALRTFVRIGGSVLATSFLNVLFQNIYSFFVGNRAGLGSLGYYTQGDKWSKMGVMSLSQTMTSSFLPVLSGVQDDPGRFSRVSAKINRFAWYTTLPAMGMLTMAATAIFHTLFGVKWDAAIALFQLLSIRGIFTIMTLQYNNIVLAAGKAREVVRLEVLRDAVSLVALIITLPVIAETRGTDITYGLRMMVYGQLIASAVTWAATLWRTAGIAGLNAGRMLADGVPYLLATFLAVSGMYVLSMFMTSAPMLLITQVPLGAGVYIGANAMAGSVIQSEMLRMIFKRGKREPTI